MAKKMKLDFIGIGAPKCGTTWLADCLREHPAIYLPYQKEIGFFDYVDKGSNYSKGLKWYFSFFKRAKEGQKKGEFTTQYIYFPDACDLIRKNFPEVKILVCLRKPEDMVYSFYWWRRANYEHSLLPKTFEEAIKKDEKYIDWGLFYKHLKKFYEVFPKENIKVVLTDDVKKDSKSVIRKVYGFLGVDPSFVPLALERKVNRAKKPRFVFLGEMAVLLISFLRKIGLDKFVKTITRSMLISDIYTAINKKDFDYPPIDEKTRMKLKSVFRNDLKKLEKLIERDLSSWQI